MYRNNPSLIQKERGFEQKIIIRRITKRIIEGRSIRGGAKLKIGGFFFIKKNPHQIRGKKVI